MAPKRKLRFEYGKHRDSLWYWHIKSGNNEIIAQGEGYKSRSSVLKVAGLLIGFLSEAELVRII